MSAPAGHRPEHVPVLPAQVLAHLAPGAGDTYVDCTAGLGGHAGMVAGLLGPGATIVLNDLDAGNLALAQAHVQSAAPGARVLTHRGSFSALPHWLKQHATAADLVLADLGFASTQVDDPRRGLSFMHDGPLDMRLDPQGPLTCETLVNSASEGELEQIIRDYGEERHAKLVARRIVDRRRQEPLRTTAQLASAVRSALASKGSGGIDPATRTFQALRIAVNDELGHLEAWLDLVAQGAQAAARGAPTWLRPGARVVVISFHSLEDRPVKRAFIELVRAGLAQGLTKEPVEADAQEIARNVRSRSAKLRAIRLRS